MPELPEVETIRRSLQRVIRGKKVSSFWTNWPKKVTPKPVTLLKRISGATVASVTRRAKILIITLSTGDSLALHLKLTGQLIYQPKHGKIVFGGHPQPGGLDFLPNKFTHHIFSFRDGSKLFFNDLRKFGWVKLVNRQQAIQLVGELGVEPLSKKFTFSRFAALLARYPNRTIKQVVMDQKFISGIGNIYADESLYAARIRPSRRMHTITQKELRTLHRQIVLLLKKAVRYKGTSTDSIYRNIDGAPGGFSKFLTVYGRKDGRCRRCKSKIVKIKLNGRGTHYCANCQR